MHHSLIIHLIIKEVLIMGISNTIGKKILKNLSYEEKY